MKRKAIILLFFLSTIVCSYAQLKVASDGNVGIKESIPTKDLHITSNSPGIKLTNGNNSSFTIENCKVSPWTGVNTFAIMDNTGYPKFEIRPTYSGIHDKLFVGIGYSGDSPVLELATKGYMLLNCGGSYNSGILFRETGTYTKNAVEYGAKIEYNESYDCLEFLTMNHYEGKNGIVIHRAYGNVGIGGYNWGNTYKLKVTGDMYTTGLYLTSDERFKKNIGKVGNDKKDKLKLIEAVSYTLDLGQVEQANKSPKNKVILDTTVNNVIVDSLIPDSKKEKIKYGFIAQEVKNIFPELVSEDEESYLSIDYIGFIPLLLEAYKNQEMEIEALKEELVVLSDNLADLQECCRSDVKALKNGTVQTPNSSTVEKESILYQNTPNPFTGNTTVNYGLSDNAINAQICIYNLNGTQLQSYALDIQKEGQITIEGSRFDAGLYLYSLIVNGELIDTKTMALTK